MLGRSCVMVLLLAVGAAFTASPTSPTTASDVLGTWTGSVADDSGLSGAASLSLTTQNVQGVSGTFTMTSSASMLAVSGAASGPAVGSTISLFLVPSTPLVCSPNVTLSGSISANLTLANGRLTGRYFGVTCGASRSGTLDLSK